MHHDTPVPGGEGPGVGFLFTPLTTLTPMEPPATPTPAAAPAPADQHLVAFLADRDLPCPACTYNLRGLQSNRCPECNRDLELQIRLAEPKQGAWVASIAGASIMAGFHTLMLGYFLWIKIIKMYGPRWADVWPLVIFAPLGGALLWWLLTGRRAFCNRSDAVRRSWAAGICMTAICSAVLFFMIIR